MIQIKLKDVTGKTLTQDVEVGQLLMAWDKYRQQGHTILSIKNQDKTSLASSRTKLDIYIFAKELLILLEAGLKYSWSLSDLYIKRR